MPVPLLPGAQHSSLVLLPTLTQCLLFHTVMLQPSALHRSRSFNNWWASEASHETLLIMTPNFGLNHQTYSFHWCKKIHLLTMVTVFNLQLPSPRVPTHFCTIYCVFTLHCHFFSPFSCPQAQFSPSQPYMIQVSLLTYSTSHLHVNLAALIRPLSCEAVNVSTIEKLHCLSVIISNSST